MKKCLRPISIIIALCMTMLMLASCGSKEQLSFTDTIKSGMDIKEGTQTTEFTFKIKADGAADNMPQQALSIINALGIDLNNIVIGLKTETQYKQETNESIVNISYKLGVNDYNKITDIIIKDKSMYINIKSIANELSSLAKTAMGNQYLDVSEYIEKDYIRIDLSDLESLVSNASNKTNNVQITDEQAKQIQDVVTSLVGAIIPSLQTTIDNLGSTVLSEQNGLQVITINNANIAEIMKQFVLAVESNINDILDTLVNSLEKLGGEIAQYSSIIKQSRDTIVSNISTYSKQIQDGINEMVTEINNEGVTFNITVGTGFNESTFILKGDVAYSANNISVSSAYSITRTPGTFAGANAPSSYYTMDELTSGSLMNFAA